MKIYLVRHGETAYNREGRLQGQSDVPLNETGRSQAEALARRLGDEFAAAGETVADIYCSPLSRTAQTARTIGGVFHKEPRVDSGLKEMDMGRWEGKTPAEIKQSDPCVNGVPLLQRWKEDPLSYAVPGGEHVSQVDRRVMASLEEIVRSHGPRDNVIVVTHGGPIGVVISHALKQSLKEAPKIKLENASLTVLETGKGLETMKLLSVNDVGHLEASPHR